MIIYFKGTRDIFQREHEGYFNREQGRKDEILREHTTFPARSSLMKQKKQNEDG